MNGILLERDHIPLRRFRSDAGWRRRGFSFWTGMVDYAGGKDALLTWPVRDPGKAGTH